MSKEVRIDTKEIYIDIHSLSLVSFGLAQLSYIPHIELEEQN